MDFSLAPNILFYIAGFPVTNTLLTTIVLSVLLMLVFSVAARRMKTVPTGFQVWLEAIVVGAHDFLAETSQSKTVTRRLFPYLLTCLLLFLVGNLVSYLPGLGTILYHGAPIYRTATTDYNLVLILAVFFLLIVQATSIITGGLLGYIKKFLNFKSPLDFVLGLMDIIGEIAKLVSVSFRFFGNAFAGEVLIAVLLFIFPYVLPLPFMALLLISAIVQPAVFSILVVIYIQMGIAEKKVEEVNS